MKGATTKLLEKAARSLKAAERLMQSGDAEFAVGRAYYGMFYTAQALLNEKNLRFRRHGGAHGAFAKHFIKTALFDKKYHRWLLAAFNKRITGDYGIDAELTSEDASLLIGQAREFLEVASRFLEERT